MLNKSKISQYKIKKILKYFAEDYTSSEASLLTKLNRKTVNRYYQTFRKTFRSLLIKIIQETNPQKNYIGYIKGKYGPKSYLNVYKLSSKFFLITKLIEKPDGNKNLLRDKDFETFISFTHERFSKFYGLTEQSYYYQIIESSFKYAYTKEELFNLIWKCLTKATRKNGVFVY